MEKYNLVSVTLIKNGSDVVSAHVDDVKRVITINPSFISTIELKGDGKYFHFYRVITMSDGRSFKVSA